MLRKWGGYLIVPQGIVERLKRIWLREGTVIESSRLIKLLGIWELPILTHKELSGDIDYNYCGYLVIDGSVHLNRSISYNMNRESCEQKK